MNPNYTYLYNNLSPEVKKITNIYRSLSPVVIKTFGGNNFVYERKYQVKTNNDINDSEYEYIDNELKKSEVIKPHTAYTELSTQENMSLFGSQIQKPTIRYYQNRTNINTEEDKYFNSGNDGSLLKERKNNKTRTYIGNNGKYKYKILKKEEINEIIFSNGKLKNKGQKNNNYQNFRNSIKNIELVSQSFSTSIIPEKKLLNKINGNKIFEIKYIKDKKSFPNKEIELKILNNSYNSKKRNSSYPKTKFNLDEFNIDKLKELGDNYEMRLTQNKNLLNQNNSEIIKNMIIIKEKRKLPNKKMNLLLKSMDNIKNKNKKISSNENNFRVKTQNRINKTNLNIINKENNKKIKIINIDKKNIEYLKREVTPNIIKIKLKHKIMGKYFNFYPNNSESNERRNLYYNKIHNINNFNNNINKIENKISYNNSSIKRKILQKTPDKNIFKYLKNGNKTKYNKNKKFNISGRNKKIDLNNMNHSYLESININKKDWKTKTKHSFNNIFLPSQ